MNLGGKSITRPRRTSLLEQRQRGHLGLKRDKGYGFFCFLKWTSPAEDAQHHCRRGSCRQSSPLQSVARQLGLIPPVQTVWNFTSRDEVWNGTPALQLIRISRKTVILANTQVLPSHIPSAIGHLQIQSRKQFCLSIFQAPQVYIKSESNSNRTLTIPEVDEI